MCYSIGVPMKTPPDDAAEDEELAVEPSPPAVLRLNVLQNAYDSIEESLRCFERSEDQPTAMKFAVIHAAQGIELLLKARLAQEHATLVWTDPGKPDKHTVTVDAALARLRACGVEFEAELVGRLKSASDLRNAFVHYEIEAEEQQIRRRFVDLIEFAHTFHLSAFEEELHDHLHEDLYPAEAYAMEEFQTKFIVYQGSVVHHIFPAELVDAQFLLTVEVDGEMFDRIRCKERFDFVRAQFEVCADCSALPGQLHAAHCDQEVCPKCHEQLIGMHDCEWTFFPED